jgi:hypothetical protein
MLRTSYSQILNSSRDFSTGTAERLLEANAGATLLYVHYRVSTGSREAKQRTCGS